MTLAITPAAKQMLAVGGLDPVFGARPLKRLVQREVVDAIAAAISFMLSANFGLYKEQKIVYSKIRAEFINRYTD